MKNLTQKFRGSLPQNNKKLTDAHPDFVGRIQMQNANWSAAAWLNTTKQNVPYLSLQLTGDGPAQNEKIKVAIWKNHERRRENSEDPHFESVQEMFGQEFQLKAWVTPVGDDYHLELTIEPTNGEISEALAATKKRLSDFLAESGVARLLSISTPASTPVTGITQNDDEPDHTPF
jgi:hypothetical protein